MTLEHVLISILLTLITINNVLLFLKSKRYENKIKELEESNRQLLKAFAREVKRLR